MVELRKRKAQPLDTGRESKRVQTPIPTLKRAPENIKASASSSHNARHQIPKAGETLDLSHFGGEFESHDGKKLTLKDLVDCSKSGVVLFTYPRASTPGCTKQACLFRDNHDSLTASGLSVYGLSADSPKANTTFKTKQNLPYTLLCNPCYSLIAALGLKKMPRGTLRGVFAINKQGEVLLHKVGGPDATFDAARRLADAW
ncbi:thioredoxin peroxidase DOT5 [Aspergillus homomorphus CBS 101889]|uniref:thioredoxin-dependent peroxiredoxin n=1 Tax=Aspergillus homomorphus (strain CBS 101889) TaxID=1450537 RepID=A0A395I947_ASPHC|nr:AhpC-TSA-domain-containing protein [Aspergillus homomorphus CBS 101889]RAL16561.1 AhpC-TSA-domain-containing protein [Aspergillus homomorphus CBS 101889]